MSVRKLRGITRELTTIPKSSEIMLDRKFERGMVTAEYALGTVATTGIAGILIWLSQQEWLRELIANLFKQLISNYL